MYRKLPVLYNPREKEKERLIADFIVRQKEFKEIFDDLKASKMETPEQHYLVVGQRGMGKTTLLYRLRYAVEDEKKLKKWLIPVSFPEENYRIADLAGVWEYVTEYLSDDFEGFEELEAQMSELEQNKDFERNAFDLLISHLKIQKKKLVLLIDNFDTLLDKIGEEGKRLRQILQTSSEIRLVVASAKPLEGNYQYDEEFFEFFREIRLRGIGLEEIKGLFRGLAQTDEEKEKIEFIITKEPHRIEIMRILTGGVIRTMILLFEIFLDSDDGKAFADLEAVLDHVTTLYKHRMDDLKSQQQLIVDAVARAWDSVSVKNLVSDGKLIRNNLDSKKISAQLTALVNNGIIEKVETDTKNHLYRIRERFFNIWYLMRNTRRKDQKRVLWLVRFYEIWCSTEELLTQATDLTKALKEKTYPRESAQIKGLALILSKGIDPIIKSELGESLADFIETFDQGTADFIRKVLIEEVFEGEEGLHAYGPIIYYLGRGDVKSARKAYDKYSNSEFPLKIVLSATIFILEEDFHAFANVFENSKPHITNLFIDISNFVTKINKNVPDIEFPYTPLLRFLLKQMQREGPDVKEINFELILALLSEMIEKRKVRELVRELEKWKKSPFDFLYYLVLSETGLMPEKLIGLSKEKMLVIARFKVALATVKVGHEVMGKFFEELIKSANSEKGKSSTDPVS